MPSAMRRNRRRSGGAPAERPHHGDLSGSLGDQRVRGGAQQHQRDHTRDHPSMTISVLICRMSSSIGVVPLGR